MFIIWYYKKNKKQKKNSFHGIFACDQKIKTWKQREDTSIRIKIAFELKSIHLKQHTHYTDTRKPHNNSHLRNKEIF